LRTLFYATLQKCRFASGPAKNHTTQRYTDEMDFKLASRTFILAIAGGTFALTAFAQWQWIDKDGRKVFSDRSPPADIQEKDILKRPGGNTRVAAAPAIASAPAAPAAAAGKTSAPKLSGKDAELEARKKQAEEQEATKKKAEEEKVAKAKAENCERAKRYLTTLQSGVRISQTNAKGEREIMDDSKRAEETKHAQEASDTSCK
jgi:hypothetical protein